MKVNATLIGLVSTSADVLTVSQAIGKKYFDLTKAEGSAADSIRKHILTMKPRAMQYPNSAYYHAAEALKESGINVIDIEDHEMVYGFFLKAGYVEQLADGTVVFRRTSKGPNPIEAAAKNDFGDIIMVNPEGKTTSHLKPNKYWLSRLVSFGKKMVVTTRERTVQGNTVSMFQKLYTKGNESMRTVVTTKDSIVVTDTGSRPTFTQTVLSLSPESGLVAESIKTSDLTASTFTYNKSPYSIEIFCNDELYFRAALEDA